MRPLRHRITACLAGLAYLLASALSGVLHTHTHGAPHAHEHCLASDHGRWHHSPDNRLRDEWDSAGSSESHEPTPQPLSDDHCAACRFVSHSAVCQLPAADPAPLRVVAETRVVAPRFFAEPVRGRRLARAPPLG